MDFYVTVLAGIVLLTFITRYFDYVKAKIRAESESPARSEIEEIRAELGAIREMVADVLLELDTQAKLKAGDTKDDAPIDGRG